MAFMKHFKQFFKTQLQNIIKPDIYKVYKRFQMLFTYFENYLTNYLLYDDK